MDDQTRENETYIANLREQGLLLELPEVQGYTMWRGQKIPNYNKWRDDES
jgi:hypothetical protein